MNNKLLILLIIIVSGLLSSCSDDKSPTSGKGSKLSGKAQSTPIEVAQAEIATAKAYYLTTAILEPSSDAQIFARTAGVVRHIFREEGDDVKAGEVLLQLEDDDQKLRVKQAQQNFLSREREYKRLNKMRQSGAVSSNDWEVNQNAYLSAKTDLELAQLALSYTKVTSSFAGRLVRREVDLGAHVLVGKLLFRVMAINPLLVRVYVPANRIGKVSAGQTVDLLVDSVDGALQGKVELVSPIVDPDTGTIKVTVRLESYPSSVRPGDFTQVKMITDSRENALMLPSGSLIEERGLHYLFVEQDQKALRKTVTVGFVSEDKTEITGGLERDEWVVVKGHRSLNDGDAVRALNRESSEPDDTENKNNKPLISQ